MIPQLSLIYVGDSCRVTQKEDKIYQREYFTINHNEL